MEHPRATIKPPCGRALSPALSKIKASASARERRFMGKCAFQPPRERPPRLSPESERACGKRPEAGTRAKRVIRVVTGKPRLLHRSA